MLAGLFLLTGLAVLAAPLYGRWYQAMRREDDRPLTRTYPPPAPEACGPPLDARSAACEFPPSPPSTLSAVDAAAAQ